MFGVAFFLRVMECKMLPRELWDLIEEKSPGDGYKIILLTKLKSLSRKNATSHLSDQSDPPKLMREDEKKTYLGCYQEVNTAILKEVQECLAGSGHCL